MNYRKRSDGIWVTRAIVETKPNVWTNHRIQVFRKKSIFCVFGGPKKLFGTPKTLIGLRNHILLKLFDPSYHLWATNGKTGIFWHNQPWKSPKLWLRSKAWPPHKKVRPNKVSGVPKSFLCPPKCRKIDFRKKNLNSVICLNIGFGFHSGPGDPVTIRPFQTIHLSNLK